MPSASTSAAAAEHRERPAGEAKPTSAPAKEESIRIDAVKLDALLEVAGESVQAANQAAVLLERLQQFKFEGQAATLMSALTETLERASRYSTELQRATLATRMQPVGRLFQKFPRLVRELAKDLGKEVELTIEGAETEVDRVVVDSLYDPLVHMLRNALDHGVEAPDERLAKGKAPRAYISLKAWQEANSVMIVLQDDGKGMDPVALRRKAAEKGLISPNANLSDDESYQLVFLPGFSTKEVASSVSGRGVGMDVVKTAVEKNRGAIHIESQLGKGTKFAIRLPIELSIVPTMLVSTSGALLALPMAVVERVVELPEVFMEVGGAPVLKDQGRPLPVRSLHPGRVGRGRHGRPGDQADDRAVGGRHYRHRPFRRGRTGPGGRAIVPDGRLQGKCTDGGLKPPPKNEITSLQPPKKGLQAFFIWRHTPKSTLNCSQGGKQPDFALHKIWHNQTDHLNRQHHENALRQTLGIPRSTH
jgi:two-component system chemotaxis sensor kinase CheA